MPSTTLSPSSRTSLQPVIDAIILARRQGQAAAAAGYDGALSTTDQAYAVQAAVAHEFDWFGANVPGCWKSGGPNRETALTHAPLPPAGVWNSPAAAGAFPFHQRGIEAEVALRLGRDIDQATAETLDETSASALLDAMTVSIEIVDSRWQECMKAPALMRLADLQCHGALVLGEWRPWQALDWARQACRVEIGDRPAVDRRGTHPMGSPAWCLPAWLRHATRHGQVVPAGTVVTTGTWVGILEAQAGERVLVTFEGIGSAQVQL
ncbi:fumarylacetoacetate hydrolase family protein [Castellaniella sp.]|uniref:fumarylacetoacetate hydrolase family protein n=1 Tax=Castellaniella sp. TaxID=1955812 RepID=UPI003C75684B